VRLIHISTQQRLIFIRSNIDRANASGLEEAKVVVASIALAEAYSYPWLRFVSFALPVGAPSLETHVILMAIRFFGQVSQ